MRPRSKRSPPFEHSDSRYPRPWEDRQVELALHLPLMQFGDEPLSRARLERSVDAARDGGFAAVSANDHLLYATPWLDGPSALAAALGRSGGMDIATTIALSVIRGPVMLAKTLTALDVLSEGRVVAGVGPGSSKRDYDAVGVPFEERWPRFDESLAVLRHLIAGAAAPADPRFYPLAPEVDLAPGPWNGRAIPIWVGSWGSVAGLRRVARMGDGWLGSAYNATPDDFAEGRAGLPAGFPSALATMWTWVTEDAAERERVLSTVLAPLLKRDPEALRGQLCVGPAEHCAELLSRYAAAGCGRVYFWPLGDEPAQIELLASEVAARLAH